MIIFCTGKLPSMSRTFALLFLFICAGFGAAQTPSVFEGSRPELVFTIEKQPIGTEIVDVTALDPNYDQNLLRDQLMDLGKRLGDGPRGLSIVYSSSEQMKDPKAPSTDPKFVRARFGMAGLVEGDKLKINPILQSVAGGKVKEIAIVFVGEKASPYRLKDYKDDATEIKAQSIDSPPSLEYRAKLLSAKADDYKVPDSYDNPNQAGEAKKAPASQGGPSMYLIVAGVVIAAVSIGLLVYSRMMRQLPANRK